MRRIGKIGKRNIKANRALKEAFQEDGIEWCELCGSNVNLTFAHYKKRVEYRRKDKQHLLSDKRNVLLLCVKCHDKIEVSRDLTRKAFKRLRGKECFDLWGERW